MVRIRHTRVASRSVLGKRRRTGNASRPFKRRRMVRGRRVTNFTSQSSGGSGLRFRSRFIRKSAYRRILYRDTAAAIHFRSVLANTLLGACDILQSNVFITLTPSIRFVDPFYTAIGGTSNPNGVAVPPSFNGPIIIRGGKIGLNIANKIDADSSREVINVQVFLIKTGAEYDPLLLTTTQPVGWDPSLIRDFSRDIGRVVYSRRFLLRDQDVVNIERRLPVMKIDQTAYNANRLSYVWLIACNNPDTIGARQVQITRYYNLSFSGEA